MPGDYRISLGLIAVGAIIVYVIFLFPPLTSGGNSMSAGVSKAKFEAVFNEELEYCQRKPDDRNCQCFARISGSIRAAEAPKVPGAVYADQKELARGQAEKSC